MIHFHIISLFPESVRPYLESSMLGRAQADKMIKVSYYNPRDFTKSKHKRVDDKPYGGGPGMVLEAPSYLAAASKAIGKKSNVEVIFFTPSGEQFTNQIARELTSVPKAKGLRLRKSTKHIVLLCAHYEGLDARVPQALGARHISVGPFVLTGGELPAAIVIDATARHIEGVLGSADSIEEARNASPEVYTRPETLKYKGKEYKVPEVLLSGHHSKIEQWRKSKSKNAKQQDSVL
jgi:tRNA (guanine37-N1)-methyltransferase